MIKKSLHMMIHFRCKSRLFVLGTSSCKTLSNVLSKPPESEVNRFTAEVALFYSGKQYLYMRRPSWYKYAKTRNVHCLKMIIVL